VLGIDDREHGEAGLLHDEVAELGPIGLGAVDLQGVLAFLREARIVTEGAEVAAFHRFFLFLDGVDEAALDVLFGAGAVADDERGSVIGFGFLDRLDGRGGVGA